MSRPRTALRTLRAKRVRLLVLGALLVVLGGTLAWAGSELRQPARTASTARSAAVPQPPARDSEGPRAVTRPSGRLSLHDAPAPSSFALLGIGVAVFGLSYARQRRRVQSA